jgi:copper(I)-binding protein
VALAAAAMIMGITFGSQSNAADPGVWIEEAWVKPDPNDPERSEVYLVINNSGRDDVILTEVGSPIATSSRIMRPSGAEMLGGALIPVHSELYMMPGGVYVALEGITVPMRPGSRVPLQLTLSANTLAQVEATVLAEGAAPPDHHDYVHN